MPPKKISIKTAFKVGGAAVDIAVGQAQQARRQQKNQHIRAREEAFARQERENLRVQHEALAHEEALKNYPNLADHVLQQLYPLSNCQSNMPPNQDGKTLPYLLLLHNNIEDFELLINQKNYKVHLPQFGKYNPLTLLLSRNDADVILKRIRESLFSAEYAFIAQEILAEFSNHKNQTYDAILNWLFQYNKFPESLLIDWFYTQPVAQTRKFVESLENELGIQQIIAVALDTISDEKNCVSILEPIVLYAVASQYRPNLINLAAKTYSNQFEFTQQLLSSLPQIIDSADLRQKFLSKLLATTAEPLPILKQWYIKNNYFYVETFLQDMTRIRQQRLAVQCLRFFPSHPCIPISENFLHDLVHPNTPMNCVGEPHFVAMHTYLNALYPKLSAGNLRNLKALTLKALKDDTSQALTLFNWFLTLKKPFFDTEADTKAFLGQNESSRKLILEQIFATYPNNLEQIQNYLLQCYGGKPFDLKTMHRDLQAIQQAQWTPIIIKYLAENPYSEMIISAELFHVIDPLELGSLSDLVTKLAHLKNKTTIRSFLDSAPTSLNYKLSLIYSFPEIFQAENYYHLFKNCIRPTEILPQYRLIESYLKEQDDFVKKDTNIPLNNDDLKQPGATLEEENIPTVNPQQSIASSSVLTPKLSKIAQKILLAFLRVAFYEMSSSEEIMYFSRLFKVEWINYHFFPWYIEIMHKWAQISVMLRSKEKVDVGLKNKVSDFMEESAFPIDTQWYHLSILKNAGFFKSKENLMFLKMNQQHQNKHVMGFVKNHELNSEYLKVEEQFNKIFHEL